MAADTNMRILVVDDFDVVRRDVKILLKRIGFTNVDVAEDGHDAFVKLRSGKDYGLVISDLTMKVMGGLDLLKSVRADPEIGGTRFIMVTGHNETESVVAAKKAGVNGYIIKPFNHIILKQRLEALLGPIPAASAAPLPALSA